MSRFIHFSSMLNPRMLPWMRAFVFFSLFLCVCAGGARAQFQLPPVSWPQIHVAPSSKILAAAQEERWREEEIHRYAPGGRSTMLDEKSGDYIKLVIAPLLLFIVALAVVRLFDS